MMDALAIILPFFVTGLLLPKVIKWCEEQQAIDTPNDRSSHSTPTPRGGGILIITVVTFAWVVFIYNGLRDPFLLTLPILALPLAYIGWRDDLGGVPAQWRLLTQLVVTSVGVALLPHIFTFMPLWLEKPLLALAWVWFINLYNFMDGMDGLAATEAFIIAAGISLLCPEAKWPALAVAGGALGFLRFNRPTAKIFLGDVGSTWLGFILAGLLLFTLSQHGTDLLIPLLLLPLLFVADATYTLMKRLIQGKKPWQAHREHWYQRALQLGMTHTQVLLRACGINMILLVLAIVSAYIHAWWLGIIGILLLVYAALRIKWLES